jgi:GTPase
MKFVDLVLIHAKAGHGGVGAVSFRREKFVPKGGPDGGDGGKGGSILVRANRHLATLLDFQYKRDYSAPRGEHGLGSNKTGRSAHDVTLEVPVGTLIRNTATGDIMADLTDHGQEVVVARGGRGGRGNASFATSTDQAPRHYEQGEDGEEVELELELKLLADVGLVGLPNVGKSTLISVISAARPKIADYPFTTLVPNLGIVRVDEGRSFVVADIPGLIEGAHLGKGLGIQFLRHIERTKVLVFLLEANRPDPKKDYQVLLKELKLFNADLPSKPKLVALSKIDTVDDATRAKLGKLRFRGVPVMPISAVTGEGTRDLVVAMWKSIGRQDDGEEDSPQQEAGEQKPEVRGKTSEARKQRSGARSRRKGERGKKNKSEK